MTAQSAYTYDAFGLSIESDFPLHELRPTDAARAPDLVIRNHPIGRPMPTREEGVVMDYTDPKGVLMAWPEVAGFRFVDDQTIWAEKPEATTDRMLAFPLLGPVMAWALNSIGLFVLHASTVQVNGRTIAFLGDKLAGKSTTAAAFVRAGHSLVTDDLLAIEMTKGKRPMCRPAFPQVKLEDKAAKSVIIDGADAQPLVMEGFPKRQHRLETMVTSATSIDCLVRLERGGNEPVFEALPTPQAIDCLARFSYMPRFASAPWTKADDHKHFSHCVGLADQSLVGRLQVPDDLERLDETVDLVANLLNGLPE
ncbi:MAG: serine kinase [Pseudomonadota bacterium]